MRTSYQFMTKATSNDVIGGYAVQINSFVLIIERLKKGHDRYHMIDIVDISVSLQKWRHSMDSDFI